jgi:uncharacterized protein
MVPTCLEEEIICFADLFYSKKSGSLAIQKSPDNVRASLMKFSARKIEIFEAWQRKFSTTP